MSKVFEYFDGQGIDEEPCCVPVMETGRCACGEVSEPTDADLMDIEINLDDMLWDDDNED